MKAIDCCMASAEIAIYIHLFVSLSFLFFYTYTVQMPKANKLVLLRYGSVVYVMMVTIFWFFIFIWSISLCWVILHILNNMLFEHVKAVYLSMIQLVLIS